MWAGSHWRGWWMGGGGSMLVVVLTDVLWCRRRVYFRLCVVVQNI